MPRSAMFTRSVILLGVLAAVLPAQPAPIEDSAVASETSSQPAVSLSQENVRLQIARNGNEVLVAWELPALETPIKGIDVYRNTNEKTKGRARLDFVKARPGLFRDTVEDSEAVYWYWLKIVLTSGQSVTVGPVATPGGKIWTP